MTGETDPATPLAVRERRSLADLFDDLGPDAPTLCAGWATRDLVAHLVLREGHPAALGIVLPLAAGWTERKRRDLAQGDYAVLVDRFRNGPPTVSPMRLPGADRAANTFEHVVHHEDVRRAQASWHPRRLEIADQREIWDRLARLARWYLRSSPVAVDLVAPGFGTARHAHPGNGVTVTGEPVELLLHVHGRREQSVVEVTGSEDAVTAWNGHELRV